MSEELWDIPPSWAWEKIDAVGRVVSGGTPSTKEPSFWGEEVVWFSPADLTGYRAKYIARGAKSLSRKGLSNSSAQLMSPGAVMFSSRAPIGYVAITTVEAATNQGFKSILPDEGVFNEYLYYYLKAAKHLAEERATGTTFKEISGSAFAKLPVPVAPSAEQRRIVAKIEELFSELDKGVESLTTAREQLKAYRQTVLKAAFEGKLTEDWRTENPDTIETSEILLARIKKEREDRYLSAISEWETTSMNWRGGNEKPPKPKRPRELSALAHAGKTNGIWPILELGDVLSVSSGQGLTAQQMRDGPYAVYGGNGINGRHDEYFVEGPELVIGRVGAKCGVTHITLPKSWVTDNALIVTPLIANFDKHFFKWLLEIKNLNVLGSSTGQPVISGSKIYPVEIGLPSYAEQVEIVRILESKLEAADVMDGEIEAGLARADALRQSILKRAFSGQLVAQDAADEPASVLLERIRAEREEGGATKRRNNKNGKKEAA